MDWGFMMVDHGMVADHWSPAVIPMMGDQAMHTTCSKTKHPKLLHQALAKTLFVKKTARGFIWIMDLFFDALQILLSIFAS